MRHACLLIPAALLFAASGLGAQATTEASQIVVTGRAEVNLVPDRAVVSIAVLTRTETAAGAGSGNAETVQRVREAIVRLGVAADSIHTAGYAVQPNYPDPSTPEHTEGYIATAVLRVRTSALAQVGAIIDAALGAGANRIDGVEFSASGQPQARRRALALAMDEARADAEAIARAGGGTLGPLIEISTGPEGVQRGYSGANIMIRGADSGGTTLNAAELRLGVAVYARYRFLPR